MANGVTIANAIIINGINFFLIVSFFIVCCLLFVVFFLILEQALFADPRNQGVTLLFTSFVYFLNRLNISLRTNGKNKGEHTERTNKPKTIGRSGMIKEWADEVFLMAFA